MPKQSTCPAVDPTTTAAPAAGLKDATTHGKDQASRHFEDSRFAGLHAGTLAPRDPAAKWHVVGKWAMLFLIFLATLLLADVYIGKALGQAAHDAVNFSPVGKG
jgi:hypothetical protein